MPQDVPLTEGLGLAMPMSIDGLLVTANKQHLAEAESTCSIDGEALFDFGEPGEAAGLADALQVALNGFKQGFQARGVKFIDRCLQDIEAFV